MKKFSIIIPVYNVERYLSKSLDSVINQTLKDIEIICIDDGSTDNSLRILNEYAAKDSRIIIIKQENHGQGIARNKGVDIANGQYVLFVDPDDWIEENTLDVLYKKFTDSGVDVIFFDYKKINEYSGEEKLYTFAKEIKKQNYKLDFEKNPYFNWKAIKKYCLNGLRLMVWDKAYSLDFLRKYNIKCAPHKHSEDHIFSITTCLKADKILYLNEYFYNYRCRHGSAVNIKSDENFCIFDNIQYITDFLVKENLLDELKNEFTNYKIANLWWHFERIPDKSRGKYIEMCKNVLSAGDYKKLIKKIRNRNKSFIENIFSIKNRIVNARKFKIVTLFGQEIKISTHRSKHLKKPGSSLVSIILPVYNAEKTIKRCLNALIEQTYPNIEVVCVNDGSTDNSLEILNEFAKKDERIKVFNNENHGAAKSRNFALSHACGAYIMFCDADDRYEKDMVETMVSAVVENNVDIAMCDCNIIDLSDGKLQNESVNNYHYLHLKGFYKLTEKNLRKINVVLWNKIFKKDIIDRYNIEYPEKYEHDDCIFVYKYLSQCKTYYGVDKELYNYVVGNINSLMGKIFSNRNNESKFDFISCWQNLYDFLNMHKTPFKNYFIKSSKSQIRVFYTMLKKQDKEKAYLLIKQLIEKNPMLLEYEEFVEINNTRTIEEFEKTFYKQKVSTLEKIFSIKNNYQKTHKVLRILGIKINIKKKTKQKSKINLGENNV